MWYKKGIRKDTLSVEQRLQKVISSVFALFIVQLVPKREAATLLEMLKMMLCKRTAHRFERKYDLNED